MYDNPSDNVAETNSGVNGGQLIYKCVIDLLPDRYIQ